MEQDALDDAVGLSLAGQREQSLQRFAAVAVHLVALPVGQVLGHPGIVVVGMEHIDGAAVYGHDDAAHALVRRQVLEHGSSEIVHGAQLGPLAGEWGYGFPPLPGGVGVAVAGCEVQETLADDGVFGRGRCLSDHVRLSDGEIDVEVGVLRLGRKGGAKQCDGSD